MSTTPRPWALLSRHGHALIHLAKNPRMRLTDLARDLDLTERSVRLLIGSLGRTEFLKIVKAGRNNSYQLDLDRELPHPLERQISLHKVIQLAMEIEKEQEKEGK